MTMKAAVIHKFGDPEVFRYEDVDIPKPKPGNILIKILASEVNRFDLYIREGSVVPELPFPHILGADASGVVAELGENVTGFKAGDSVIPLPGFSLNRDEYGIRPAGTASSFTLPGLGIPGTYAQYIEIPAQWIIKDDTGLKPEEVATFPMVLNTSVRAVKIIGEVKDGDKVLVHTGSSGSGSMHIQVAKALGAQVATTIRNEEKRKFAKKAGADVVTDNLGGDVLAKSIDAMKPLGVVVAYGFVAGTEVTFDIRNFFFGQKKLRGSMAGDIEDLKWGLDQVKAGRIQPLLDRVLPLQHAAEAHKLISTNQIAGNIVLLPWAA